MILSRKLRAASDLKRYSIDAMKKLKRLSVIIPTAIGSVFLGNLQPALALAWVWNYSATGVEASGTLTTSETPDEMGFFLITDLMGTRNGETITGLHPTGTSIPGNEPFIVDNSISLAPEQLTSSGLGFSTSGGNLINLFFADFLAPPGFFEVFSAPPLLPGWENLGPEDSELTVSFSATIVPAAPIPESTSTFFLLVLGLFGVGSVILRNRE